MQPRRALLVLLVGIEMAVAGHSAAATLQVPAEPQPEVSAPVWAKPDHFWFRKAYGDGHLYFTVDTLHGVKEPLFDHQRLAIELNLRTGYEFTPTTLPFADPAARFEVKYDGSNAYIQEGAMAVEFDLDGTHWRCDLQIKWNWNKIPPTDYECLPRRPATTAPTSPAPPAPAMSPDGRYAVEVRNFNVWLRPLVTREAPRALTTDGTADIAYDAGSLRWSEDSTTVTAYKLDADLWRSPSITANVKGMTTRVELRVR
ncbi:MAG: hypothetical protein AMXMBFR57_23370 [Acidimicrobiia bacterium]